MQTYRSNGKLLLTGEYAVLDGALSLALPTRKGQTLSLHPQQNAFSWKSYDLNGKLWFENQNIENDVGSDAPMAQTLLRILNTASELNPSFSEKRKNICVTTHLEFPRDWGLGSSSTLINNIAMWADVNPFELLFQSFGGSGYDIACAQHNTPILYQLDDDKPRAYPICFQPSFRDNLFFVHLNQKQNSRNGITHYRSIRKKGKSKLVAQLTEITEALLQFPSESEFCSLLGKHEEILADFLDLPTVKSLEFPYFEGTIKSLGAWGGDFVLAIGEASYVKQYFSAKGFSTILSYNEMILS